MARDQIMVAKGTMLTTVPLQKRNIKINCKLVALKVSFYVILLPKVN